MALYYVRKTGNDINSGTSPASAWLTIGKALGSAGIASGDTVYIGAGVYRETITVNMTSAVAETFVIADVDGSNTGDPGEVRLTAYTTNDRTAPATAATINLNGRDFLTFRKLVIVGGNGFNIPSTIDGGAVTISTNIRFEDCTILPGSDPSKDLVRFIGSTNGGSPNNGISANWLFDRCRFMRLQNDCISITIPTADNQYDLNFTIQNCLFIGGGETDSSFGNACININTSGFLTQDGGNVRCYNCTAIGGGTFMRTNSTNISSFPCRVHGCALIGCGLVASNLGEIIENYNVIFSDNTRELVNSGANSVSDGSYSVLFNITQELSQGKYGRPFMSPTIDSPFLAFGGISTPSVDMISGPRPSGPAINWSNVSTACGCLEYGNSGIRETSTIFSSSNSIRFRGPGWQDFEFPVDNVSTTISIYARYDSNYAGTLPQMRIVNSQECGVSDATDTVTGSANNWEQLSLSFTPTSRGIVTIRLQSNCTSVNGNCYFDDFSVS
jgi:hypothetical protein